MSLVPQTSSKESIMGRQKEEWMRQQELAPWSCPVFTDTLLSENTRNSRGGHMKKANLKNKQTRQSYNSEFKSEALRLAGSIGVAAAATQLGLVSGQLYSWRSQLSKKQNVSTEQQSMAAENAKLKRQLAEQAEELAILKKAAAYFAKHAKWSTLLSINTAKSFR